jgi:hypothetical protein
MGWYIHYELELEEHVDWDDDQVKIALKDINCNWLYLRDMVDPIVILSLYSQHDIKDIIKILTELYDIDIVYRIYENKMDSMNYIK